MTTAAALDQVEEAWATAYSGARQTWSPVLDLPAVRFCRTPDEERAAGLDGRFIRIDHADRSVAVSLRQVAELGLEDEADPVLAHAVGHLVLAPGDLSHHARLLARVRAGLAGHERFAPLVANLWADLIVDQRLRSLGLETIDTLRSLVSGALSPVLRLQLRAAEILAGAPEGHLSGRGPTTATEEYRQLDLDARLAVRLVLVHQTDWLAGSGPFARLLAPYVAEGCDPQTGERLLLSPDTVGAAAGPAVPEGLARMEQGELTRTQPIDDPRITGQRSTLLSVDRPGPVTPDDQIAFREPGDYLDLLQSLGITRPRPALVAQYYRERARPLVTRSRRPQRSTPDLVLGLVVPTATPDPGSRFSPTSLFASVRALDTLRAGASVAVDWTAPDGESRSPTWFDANEQDVLELLTTPPARAGRRPGVEQIRAITELVANHDRATEVLLVGDETLGAELERVDAGWVAVQRLGAMAPSTIVLRDPGPRWRVTCRAFLRRGWRVHHVDDWPDLMGLAAGLPDPLDTPARLDRSTEGAMA